MDVSRREKVIKEARSNFRYYVGSTAFKRFVMRLQKKLSRWDLIGWYQFQKSYLALKLFAKALSQEGELLLGFVLMRNVILADKDSAAPALVLGSFDFSTAGFEELHAVAERIENLRNHPDSSIRADIAEIFADDEYQLFRRRELPDCVEAPAHMIMFDEVMRGDDFFEIDIGGEVAPSPFVIMFANRNDPVLASAVVPRSVAEPVFKFLIEEKANPSPSAVPPPLPRSVPDPAPPPLPRSLPHSAPPPLPPKTAPAKGKKSVAERVVVTLSILFVAFLVFRVVQLAFHLNDHPVQREPGAEALSHASNLIVGSSRGIAHGNTAEALALARQLSQEMKKIRDTMFEGGTPNSVDARLLTKGEFLVFCQLNPESCAFLIHVPEMRRYTSSAKDSIANLAYEAAARVLDSAQKMEIRKLAIATRGSMLYDQVLTGDYRLGSSDPLSSVTRTADKGLFAPSLNAFFTPQEGPNP